MLKTKYMVNMAQETEQRSTCLAVDKVIFKDTLPLQTNEEGCLPPTKEIFNSLLLIALIPLKIVK